MLNIIQTQSHIKSVEGTSKLLMTGYSRDGFQKLTCWYESQKRTTFTIRKNRER